MIGQFFAVFATLAILWFSNGSRSGQTPAQNPPAAKATSPSTSSPTPVAPATPTHADLLRGAYGPYRANNDLLFYHLDIRVDPEKKFINGKNTIRFKMLQDGNLIQLDLHQALNVDKIMFGNKPLAYQR